MLVERAEAYEWSSARAHVDFELWRQAAPPGDWADVPVEAQPDEEPWQRRFRAATYAGTALGSKEFVGDLQKGTGQRLQLRGQGRPRKKPKARTATAGDRS